MYRKPVAKDRSGVLDLDSLMDILSCLVGVMLFLVIYTVLELGSVTYQASVPIGHLPPLGSDRVVVLCENGIVRVLDTEAALDVLLSGFAIVRTFPEVELFVDANPGSPTDAYFRYTLTHEDRLSTDLLGTLDLQVEALEGVVGDSIHQLDPASRFASILDELDPSRSWLTFAVDTESVDVFRRAREMAVSRGFATSWNQVSLDFPLTISLAERGSVDWLSETSILSKPER